MSRPIHSRLDVDRAGQQAGKGSVTSQPTLTPADFAQKWQGSTTTEKAGSQSHFIDLCRMLGEPTPHEADPTGDHYVCETAGKRIVQSLA